MDDEFDLSEIYARQQPCANEVHLSEGVTILLGRKPIDVPRPASLKQEMMVETIEDERYFPPRQLSSRVTFQALQLLSCGKLFAITNRALIKKDLETGHVTVRLFKNRTTLY